MNVECSELLLGQPQRLKGLRATASRNERCKDFAGRKGWRHRMKERRAIGRNENGFGGDRGSESGTEFQNLRGHPTVLDRRQFSKGEADLHLSDRP